MYLRKASLIGICFAHDDGYIIFFFSLFVLKSRKRCLNFILCVSKRVFFYLKQSRSTNHLTLEHKVYMFLSGIISIPFGIVLNGLKDHKRFCSSIVVAPNNNNVTKGLLNIIINRFENKEFQ